MQSLEKLSDLDIPDGRVYTADITKGVTPELEEAMKGVEAVIICTSAIPRMKAPPQVRYTRQHNPQKFSTQNSRYIFS